MSRKKITEIKVERVRKIMKRNSQGRTEMHLERYVAIRPVKVVNGGKRFGHYLLDSIVFRCIMFAVSLLIELFTFSQVDELSIHNLNMVFGAFFIAGILAIAGYPLYYTFFEHFLQRTPGKYATGSIVVNEYNEKPEFGSLILRNVLRLVPFEAFSCLGDRGWHDEWSNTFVITLEEHEKLKMLLNKEDDQETV